MADDRLSIADIERRLGGKMTRSAIQRFHAAIAQELGAEGTVYPADALPWWEAVAVARHQEGLKLRPENAAAWIRSQKAQGVQSPIIDYRLPITSQQESAIIETRSSAIENREPPAMALITPAQILEAISEGVRRSFPAPVPALPDDALLTLTEAHERYGLALSTLRVISFVEGRRRKVRRSDVLGLIQGMQSRTRDLGRRGIE